MATGLTGGLNHGDGLIQNREHVAVLRLGECLETSCQGLGICPLEA